MNATATLPQRQTVERTAKAALPTASVSLDLDNQWSYMKTHGDAGWEKLPSYFDVVVPRVLKFLEERNRRITFFVVGLDAEQDRNRDALRSIAEAGHEIGNHSYRHEPWLHLYSPEEIEREFETSEMWIERATGRRTQGFRGPGFSVSAEVLRVLKRRGYRYDASTFPTFLGPLARAYYFATAKLTPAERAKRQQLFGKFREGFRSLQPYRWRLDDGPLLEIPVTTLPILKTPMHASYILYLACFSRALALNYFRMAVNSCRWSGTPLSLLLHPLDFLGGDDVSELAFFPAMQQPGLRKAALMSELFDILEQSFSVVTMDEHATELAARPRLANRRPDL